MYNTGMKTSTVRKLFRERIKAWAATITDEHVRNLALNNVIVSGGAIASALTGGKINDYDMYFATREAAWAIAEYYVNVFNANNPALVNPGGSSRSPALRSMKRTNIKGVEEDRIIIYMKSAGVAGEGDQDNYSYFESQPEAAADEFLDSFADEEIASEVPVADQMDAAKATAEIAKEQAKKKEFRPIFLSENAITLSNKVQLVVRFYGEPSELHENYDYAHAMCSYRYSKDELICPPEALECLLSKTLVYKGSLYPIASIFRLRKFYERGWRITAGQLLKIIHQVSQLNLNDRAVLREQLIGVDQAYMHQLLRALENSEERIDATYLAKLIDEIFE